MTYLLFNKPQRLAQVNRQRRNKSTPSGVCVIHTAEGSGANNVANYILNRTSYGSYHRIIDASTTVKLAPWSAETFHCRFTNPHSVGISAATFAANWNSLYKQPGDPGHRIIDRMAIEAADFVRYMKNSHKTTVPVKRISRKDALDKKPGFLAHGDTDPGRRTDPGKDFDWDYFFARINHHLGKPSSTPSKSEPKTQPLLSKFYYPSAYYVIDGKPGPATYTAMQRFLSDRGFYKRVIDGDAGTYTWKALQEFLSDLGYFTHKPNGKQDMTTARALQQWLSNNGSYKATIAAKPKWDKATWSAFQTYLRYAHKGTKVYKRKSTTDFKPTTPAPSTTPTLPLQKDPFMALTDKEQQSLLDDNRKMKTAIERNERRLDAILDILDPKPAPKASKAQATKEAPKNG